jgi:hypothetical protein
MARLTPDPTFYPSARQAMQAPREQLAYVVTLNTGANGQTRPDARRPGANEAIASTCWTTTIEWRG